MRVTRVTCSARAIAIVVAILISSGQFFFIAIQTKAEDAKVKTSRTIERSENHTAIDASNFWHPTWRLRVR
jgi:hypothetical protein